MRTFIGKLNDEQCKVLFLEHYDFWTSMDILRGDDKESIIAVIDENSLWFSSLGVLYVGTYEKTDGQWRFPCHDNGWCARILTCSASRRDDAGDYRKYTDK